ncbi:MAG: single-stranded-DNA-specific exonuclease RecJ [Spirochaetes bacterium]|nr:single-stranded-DNA-specific exonuclease RecJ [Spirochaetota bacterium]
MCTSASSHLKELLLSHFNISPLVADLLLLRGIDTIYNAYAFLNPDLSLCYSPFLMDEMDEAVQIIKRAITNKKKIGIFADSDIDGLTSLTLLTHLLDLLGAQYFYRYPVGDELYGLTVPIIEEFKNNTVDCIVTLDSGTRDIDEIAYARNLGIDVVVCDHHEPSGNLPDAVIINPKLLSSRYPFKELAGVGVTYKLCLAVLLSYTKYYDSHIIITALSHNNIGYSVIHRGVAIAHDSVSSAEELLTLEKNYNNTIIFNYDVPELNFLKRSNFFTINDFLDELSPNCEIVKGHVKDVFPSSMDYATMLVSKLQYQQSKKILKFIHDMLPLVAIGTIADMMPMVGENRILVSNGISFFEKSNHCGLKVIREYLSKTMNTDTIGWDISPLLNTPGRFGKTKLAADFLLEKKSSKARVLLEEIVQLNQERKNIIHTLVSKFSKNEATETNSLRVICSEEIPDGLTGIIANRLADQLLQPVLVISDKSDSQIIKGSGRSRNNFDFFSCVSQFEHLFEKLGGHNHAFGFSIKKDNIPILINELDKTIMLQIEESSISDYDYELPIEQITFELLDELRLFEPHGIGQKSFIFISKNCTVSQFFIINGKHCKLIINGSIPLEAMAWNAADKYKRILSQYIPVDIVYTIKLNEYNGLMSPLLIIENITRSQLLK